MAALMRHESSLKGLKVVIKWAQTAGMAMPKLVKKFRPPRSSRLTLCNVKKPGPTFDSTAQSLATKGFLRPYKGYEPPPNVEDDISNLSIEVFGTSDKDTPIQDPKQRFHFLHACWKLTGHPIPNSSLYLLQNVGDVIRFYLTPVSTITPLEAMKKKDLPPNLHVIHNYVRFDQDPNNPFGGETAFPESSTFISDLKARKKYKNMQAKPPVYNWLKLANWPYPIKP